MLRKRVLAIVLAGALVASLSAWAQRTPADVTDLQALRTAVKADKRAFVASTLELTDAEANKFWPLYDAYQRGLDLANRERTLALEGLIGLDKPPSDLFAKSLAREMVGATRWRSAGSTDALQRADAGAAGDESCALPPARIEDPRRPGYVAARSR